MDRSELIEVLDRQTEYVQSGRPVDLEATLAGEPLLESLSRLMERVNVVLRPVEPRPEFVRTLKRALVAAPPALEPAPARRPLFWAALGLGGFVYIAGMTALSLRVSISLLAAFAVFLNLRGIKKPRARFKLAA